MAICCDLRTTDLGYPGGLVDVGSVSNTEVTAANEKHKPIYMDKLFRITSNCRSAHAKAGGSSG